MLDLSFCNFMAWQRLLKKPMRFRVVRDLGLLNNMHDFKIPNLQLFNQNMDRVWALCKILCIKPVRLMINTMQMCRR